MADLFQQRRGRILDRNGKILVANRTELAVQVRPEDLPPPGPKRRDELNRLSTVTGMTRQEIVKELEQGNRAAPGGPPSGSTGRPSSGCGPRR